MTITLEYPEGATPLDPNELGGLKYKHITTQGELDELEQANIASGLRWLARTRRKATTVGSGASWLARTASGLQRMSEVGHRWGGSPRCN
ncbi:hypothetical protein [Mesorhizobium caraganae]|uniref:hypothetical protein n=1 Tax=Mesorhizobium caraganae TaxID=483206 RepID=UPI001FEEE300|nr:hypothetical protein [Mesorhizobium caraganae]